VDGRNKPGRDEFDLDLPRSVRFAEPCPAKRRMKRALSEAV